MAWRIQFTAWFLTESLVFGNMDSPSKCSGGSCMEADDVVHLQTVRKRTDGEDVWLRVGPEADPNSVYFSRGAGFCDTKAEGGMLMWQYNATTEDELQEKCSASDKCWGYSKGGSNPNKPGPGLLYINGPVYSTPPSHYYYDDSENEWEDVYCMAKGHHVSSSDAPAVPATAARAYTSIKGKHCGGPGGTYGTSIRKWTDGTDAKYGRTDLTIDECKAMCTAHSDQCSGFVRRASDNACHWKSGALTPFSLSGHDCYEA